MEEEFKVTIRDARKEDVPLVAGCVLASVNLYDFVNDCSVEKDIALEVCGMDDTLYSYRHARIAEVNGRPAGCLVSYDGSIYAAAREKTFGLFKAAGHEMKDSAVETGPGEYYLDSMAIVPEFRGRGIGHELMKDGLALAVSCGLSRTALIVEKTKPDLQAYYSLLGFMPAGEMHAFDDEYIKMVLDSER